MDLQKSARIGEIKNKEISKTENTRNSRVDLNK